MSFCLIELSSVPFPGVTVDAGRQKKNLMIMLKENLLGTELLFEMKACHLDIVIERGMTSS